MKHLFSLLTLCTAFMLSANVTFSQFFPAEWLGKQWNFLEGYPSTLVLQFRGDGKLLAKNPPTAVLELPEFLKLRTVSTRTNWAETIPFKKESFTDKGRKMTRYKITFPARFVRGMNPKTFNWRPGFNCIIIPEKGFAGKKADFKFYFLEKGKKTFEQNYIGSLLPAPKFPSAPLKYFATGITNISSKNLPDALPVRMATSFWQKFDKKPFFGASWENYSFPAARNTFIDQNFTVYAGTFACRNSTMKFPGTNFKDLGFMVNGAVTRPGVPPFVDANGKVVKGSICPLYLISDPEGLFWGEYMKRGFNSKFKHFPNCKDVWFDFEPFVTEGTCDNCLKDFAKFAKLKTVPKRTEIRNGAPLNRKWRQYKAIQHRTILEKFVSSVKKHFPHIRIHLCTATPHPNYLDTWDVVDSSTVVNKVFAFNPMNYSVGPGYFDNVATQEKRLGKTKNFSWVDPAEESERFFRRYTPEKVLQNVIATAALGADGITFYPSDILDGKMLTCITNGLRAVKDVEEIFAKGKDVTSKAVITPKNVFSAKLADEKGKVSTVTLPDFKKDLRMVMKEHNGVYLLTLLNYSNREVYLQAAIPSFKGKGNINVADILGEVNLSGVTADKVRKGFLVKLPVDGCVVLRINGKKAAGKTIAQSTIASELNKILAKISAGGASFKGVRQGDVSINWMIHKKSPAVTISVGQQQAIINPSAATVLTWRNGKKTPLGGPTTAIGEVCFYDVANQKPLEYQLVSHKLEKDSVRIKFAASVAKDAGFGDENPLADLIVEKEFTLKRGTETQGTLEMTVTFRNPCKGAKDIGFRLKNIPIGGWSVPKKAYTVTLDGLAVNDGIIRGKANAKIKWHAVSKCVPHTGPMTANVAATWYKYTFNFPGSAAFYSWSNGKLVTAEPLYENFILAPGAAKSFSQTMKFNLK
ncbi:MAG: hypothetical protein E7048_05955 [Lentisphaerae bacterium]|nr:hypothetical protein [Lentisphaerota bacterium]